LHCGASSLPCPAYAPLACPIHKIDHQRDDREDDENPGEQHQRCQHFLDEIDLQRNESR